VTFEVPVSAVSRSRSRRGVVVVVAGSGLIALTAAITGLWAGGPLVGASGPAAPSVARPFTAAAAGEPVAPGSPSQRVALIPRILTPSVARDVPEQLRCHDVGSRSCERLVRAALRVLPADLPDVDGAAVWRSLVCNSTFDCPPGYLQDSPAAGSVILAFADGSPSVAVNVVDWRYGSGIRLGLRAWIARSAPATD
jgi:hypothetical protein